tara:strand:- start:1327 stop:1833 length:507 start_codon:yes stop_codon:yes gene_type:complete
MSVAYTKSTSQNVFVVFLVIVVCSLMYMSNKNSKEFEDIQSMDRAGDVLVSNDRADAGDQPFILNVEIVSETSKKIVFKVKYFMSETAAEGSYNISIHPDTSDWAQSMNTMRAGMNTELVTVSFRPQHPSRVKVESQILHVYVNHYNDKKYIGKVFERRVEFPKTWTM